MITLLLFLVSMGQSGVTTGLPHDFSGGWVGEWVVASSVGAAVSELVWDDDVVTGSVVEVGAPLVLKFILHVQDNIRIRIIEHHLNPS